MKHTKKKEPALSVTIFSIPIVKYIIIIISEINKKARIELHTLLVEFLYPKNPTIGNSINQASFI
ncbi:hypothetical protein SMU40_02123 [Streptococcus mutans 15VF2]|nr:hypothetical protein SMU40_02123 [Streptococcus mutans 15VF2]